MSKRTVCVCGKPAVRDGLCAEYADADLGDVMAHVGVGRASAPREVQARAAEQARAEKVDVVADEHYRLVIRLGAWAEKMTGTKAPMNTPEDALAHVERWACAAESRARRVEAVVDAARAVGMCNAAPGASKAMRKQLGRLREALCALDAATPPAPQPGGSCAHEFASSVDGTYCIKCGRIVPRPDGERKGGERG